MKRLTNIAVVGIALIFGLLLVEVASRFVVPISPGSKLLALDGSPFSGLQVDSYRYKPNAIYRQVSAEFDVRTTIDRFGNRVPSPSGSPEIILVGDSFTFGHGLADHKTFASIFCISQKLNCANLGRSGLGTTRELDILEYYLTTHNWRPKTVKLFMVAMSGALMSGNDLYDNYLRERRKSESNADKTEFGRNPIPSAAKKIAIDSSRDLLRKTKNLVLEHSNLGRFFYFTIGHQIRSTFSPPASESVLEIALKVTREQVLRFQELAKIFGFKVEIFIIHPVQDIIRGTARDTMRTLEKTVPGQEFISSAKLFSAAPASYYFSYDGHWNEAGARKFAEFLAERNTN
jgi:hypothetical protein